jgi:hypothetical protein
MISKSTKKPAAKPAAKATSKPATKGKVKAMAQEAKGYKHHKAGSRKGTLHELWDKEGRDVAWTRGKKMGLADNTLRAWFAASAREAGTGRVKKSAKVAKVKITKKANGTAATEAATSA